MVASPWGGTAVDADDRIMTSARRHATYADAWCVLAGVVSGVGLLAGSLTLGVLAMAVVLATLSLAVGSTLWSVLEQCGRPSVRPAARIGAVSGFGCTVATGLVSGLGVWGGVAFGLVVLVAPPVVGLAGRQVGRLAHEERRAQAEVELRRTFDEIIAHGYSAPSGGDERRG